MFLFTMTGVVFLLALFYGVRRSGWTLYGMAVAALGYLLIVWKL